MNHETNLVATWLANVQPWYHISLAKVYEAKDNLNLDPDEPLSENELTEVAEELEKILEKWIGGAIDRAKDLLRERAVSLDEVVIDLLEAAAAKINYRELAEDLLCE